MLLLSLIPSFDCLISLSMSIDVARDGNAKGQLPICGCKNIVLNHNNSDPVAQKAHARSNIQRLHVLRLARLPHLPSYWRSCQEQLLARLQVQLRTS